MWQSATPLWRDSTQALTRGAADAFHHLLATAPSGLDRRQCALWYRQAAACAGYHAQHAQLGVPEPARLDPLCAPAGLAVCLRALSLPYDRATVAAACRHTGEGSSAQDLLDACKKLGVVGRVVKADDAGLRALPKPLIAHIEHDHFVAVVRAGARGVSYVCSDCGCWPGGRVNLTWKQWRQLGAGVYVTVSRPGGAADRLLASLPDERHPRPAPLRLAAASLTALHVWGAPSASWLGTILRAHVVQINNPPAATVCGYKPGALHCLPWAACPMDPPCHGKGGPSRVAGPSEGDPVNLATGEEQYQPALDLTVYNPHGPAIVWRREYESLLSTGTTNPDGSIGVMRPNDSFGVGWYTPYDLVVNDPSSYTRVQAAQGGLAAIVTPTAPDAPANGMWDIVLNGVVQGWYDPNNPGAHENGWSVDIPAQDPTKLEVKAPAAAASAVGYEVRYKNGAAKSGFFDVTPAATIPEGATLALPPTGSQQTPDPQWDVLLNGTVIGNSANPSGWTVAQVTAQGNPGLAVTAPLSAATSGTYTVRVNKGGGTYSSATFAVAAPRVNYLAGTANPKNIIFPNGSSLQVTAPAVPTSQSPSQHCTAPTGAPIDVWWYYDGSQSGHFAITFHDGVTWVMSTAMQSTNGGSVSSLVASIQDSRITSDGTNPIPLKFQYGTAIGNSGFPLLASILDGSNNTALLTLNRASDGTGSLVSVSDAYNRSVYYHVGSWQNVNTPNYRELDQVSTVQTTGTVNPPVHWQYTYNTRISNGHGAEQVCFLDSITVPSPAAPCTSTARIQYDPVYAVVTSVTDANLNTRTYSTPTTPPNATQVTVSGPARPGFTYIVCYDGALNLHQALDSTGTMVERDLEYDDTSNPNRPTSITLGSIPGPGTMTTTLQWGPYGNLLSVTSPQQTKTSYNWDYSHFVMGRLTSIQQGCKPATTLSYWEPSGLVFDVNSPAPAGSGVSTTDSTFYWDNLGNMTSSNLPGNNSVGTIITTFGYPAGTAETVGHPSTITDNNNKVTQLSWSTQGDLLSVTDASGNQTSFSPNLAGQVTQITYPATGQTGTGHAVTATGYLYPGGPPSVVTAYDESNKLVRQTRLGYGPEGESISQSGSVPSAAVVYDADYRTWKLADGNGHVTETDFNSQGLPSVIKYPLGDTVQFPTWDAAGRPQKRIDENNSETDYGWGGPAQDGLLTSISYPADATQNVSFHYDQYDRRDLMKDATANDSGGGSVQYRYGNLDELVSVVTHYNNVPAQTLTYNYYRDGSRQSLVTPAGTFSYGYDFVQRLSSLTNPFSETSSWTYLDNSWLSTQTLGNQVKTTYTPNQRGFVTSLQTVPFGQSYSSWFNGMKYDGAGNRTFVQATVSAVSAYSGQINYGYDGRDELLQEQSGRGAGYTDNFLYDPAQNPLLFRSGAFISYDADNRISGNPAYVYSNAGDPTTYQGQTLAFDLEHHLIQYGTGTPPPLKAGYTGDGLRGWKANSSGTTYFLYDGSQPIIEMNGSGTITAVNTFGVDGLLSRRTGGLNGTSVFYSFDPQGNVCQRFGNQAALLSSDEYNAWGTLLATTQTGAHDVFGAGAQWGYYTDNETGLQLLTNRYYDPGTGRFLTRDPIGYAGGINLYGYVGNGPVTFADPAGLFGFPEAYVLTGAVLGGIGGAILCEGNPLCIAAGAGLGAALARYQLERDAGAALDTGVGVTCTVLTLGELGGAALSALPRGGQLSLPLEGLEEQAVSRNSLASQEPNHVYVIYDSTGEIEKFGISAGGVNAAGQSLRALEQLDKLSQRYGGTFTTEILEFHPDRASAADAERAYVTVYYETFGLKPRSNLLPNPFPPGWYR